MKDFQNKVKNHHHDHLGTTRYITNENGEILHTTDTLAYGEELTAPYENDKDEVMNTITFTGHEKDYETDLTYMLARYYSQGYGRFLSPDPGYDYDQLDPMSWNLYSYVRGNPVKSLDNNGEEKINFLINYKELKYTRNSHVSAFLSFLKQFESAFLEKYGADSVYIVNNNATLQDLQKALYSPDSEFIFIHAHGAKGKYDEHQPPQLRGKSYWEIKFKDGNLVYDEEGNFYIFVPGKPGHTDISLDKLSKKLKLIMITSCYFNQEAFQTYIRIGNEKTKVVGFSTKNTEINLTNIIKKIKEFFKKDKGKSIQIILVRDKDGLHFEAVER